MITHKKLDIKNIPSFNFSNMLNIKETDIDLVSVNQVFFINDKDYVNYEIKYFSNYVSNNTLYLIFNDVDIHFSCVDEEKYLIFALTDKNKGVLKNYRKLWDKVKEEKRTIKGGIKTFEFEKDVMKINFESDDKLPLNKVINVPMCIIIAKSVFKDKDDNYYPQVYLHSCKIKYCGNEDTFV